MRSPSSIPSTSIPTTTVWRSSAAMSIAARAFRVFGGTYFFADHNGRVWSLRFDGTQVSEFTERTAELFPAGGPQGISSFGEDAAGELYITDVFDGTVHRVTAS